MPRHSLDAVVVGAGPNGLGITRHLRKLGVECRIFGFPMAPWRRMPAGMFLKSFGFGLSIPTAEHGETLPEFCRSRGFEDFEPISIAHFADYGQSFQEKFIPDVEKVHVGNVARSGSGFDVTLANGERVQTKKVVVAIGLSYFEVVPPTIAQLPKPLFSHTSEHLDFAKYAGQDVTVIGAGQSALEAAVLLHEQGAQVRLITRRRVYWNTRFDVNRSWLEALRNPISTIGPGRENWVLQHLPMLARRLSPERRIHLARTYLGPCGAWWLRDRFEGKFTVHEGTSLVGASERGGKVCLHIESETGAQTDFQTNHVIAATGYQVDVDRLSFIPPQLGADIRRLERAPVLTRHFESSVPGLYFIGPASSMSFGPLFRFVAGAKYATKTAARHLASHR